MQPDNPATVIFDFALEHAPLVPVSRRITVYRALAQMIGSEPLAVRLNEIASEFEAIERKHRQLRLDLGDSQS